MLEPLGDTTWPQLQNLFRQRYSKLGNTHEQLFHAWRSFTFDENTETIDSYVIRIRQEATLLGYGEPQILEVFKNTLPTKLYWILFPIEDLRQAVETAKRILTKEKLDKQLTGQTSTSPFMSIRDGTDRRVSFNTREELGDKIDKLTVIMSKLAAKDSHERKPFKPQIYKSRGQNRAYGQGGYQTRSDSGNRGHIMNNNSRLNYRRIIQEFRQLDFGTVPQNLQEEYLDMYEGIQSDIVSSSRFDENSDISTTYLGKIESKEGQDKLKAEESFPISENGYTLGRLLDGTKCQLLWDTGARKSFMSKSFYMQCKSLHTLPKFAATMQKIQVGNGQCIRILFIIPVIVEIHGHRFEIYLWYLKSMKM